MSLYTTVHPYSISNHLTNTTVFANVTVGNLTNNATTPLPRTDTELNPYVVVFVEVICILVFLLGIFGNVLVMLVFGARWSKLKVCEVFMMNLAFSDLIATVVVPIKMLLELMHLSFYPIGDTGCKILSFLSMTTITVSSLTLLVISIDRFIIVRWPLRKEMECWQLTFLIFLTWFLSAAASFVFLLDDYIRLYDDPHDSIGVKHFCRNFMEVNDNIIHNFVVFAVQLVVPLVTMSVLYYLILCELRKVVRSQLFSRNERELRLRLRRNRRATCLFVTIITIFYIFVLPSNIFFLMYITGGISMPTNRVFLVYTLLQMILMLNSCINPLIYSNLHTSFRRTTLKLLCSCLFNKFKEYEWGDSVRSIVRRSTRSVRGSIQSSREMLYSLGRRSTADDVHQLNNNGSAVSRNRLSRSRLNRTSGNCSPSNMSTTTALEGFDHYSLREYHPNLQHESKEYEIGTDDVFNDSTTACLKNKHLMDSSSSSSNGENGSPSTMSRRLKKKKMLVLLREQETLEEVL